MNRMMTMTRATPTLLALSALTLSGCASAVTHTERIAYVSLHNTPSSEIDSRERRRGNLIHVTDDCIDVGDYGCFADTPAYSPDGRRIAFSFAPFLDTGATRGKFQIWVARDDGSNPVQVAMTSDDSMRPAWSPDGTRLAFEEHGAGEYEIVIADLCQASLPETSPTVLTAGSHPTWSPAVEPDLTHVGPREWIAFEREESGNLDIWKIDPTGTNLTRLTTHSADDSDPAWTKPGAERERIAFTSDRSGDGDIYSMLPDGTRVQRISSHGDPEENPDWSALGLLITYEREDDIVAAAYNGNNPRRLFEGMHPSWRQEMEPAAVCPSGDPLP